MPILPSHKSPAAIVKRFRGNLETRTAINNFDRDSKARAFTDALTEEILASRELQTEAYLSERISSARGADLDRIGLRMGRERRKSTFASTTTVEKSTAFYVEAGTFGDINGAANIVIPAGTLVASVANNNEFGQRVEFKTTVDVTLSAADSITFFACKAVVAGVTSNIGRTVISYHNFTNYVDVGNSSLKVTNFYPVLTGREQESDDQYRSRLSLHYSALMQNNEAKIKLSALAVPGVVDLKVIDGFYGIGTAGVIVLGPENNSTPMLVSAVQARLDQFKGPGLSAVAVAATEVTFSIELDVTPIRKLSEIEKRRLTSQIRKVVSGYLSGITLGGSMSLTSLASEIQSAGTGVMSIKGLRGRQSLFKKVYAQKGGSNSFPDEKKLMVGTTYQLDEDEYASAGAITVNYLD